MESCDVLVIGAGIAGLSAGAELAERCSVLVVDMEATPAHHATGRSAALYIPTYGPPAIRRLTGASRGWFESRADGLADTDLISPRLVMYASDEAHVGHLERMVENMGNAGGTLHRLDAAETRALCPALRADWVVAGGVDRDAYDMDVAAIVATYRRRLASAGGRVAPDHRVTGLDRSGAGWRVRTTAGEIGCATVVNAAGAWVDEVAGLAGLAPLGFVPKRRTIGVSPTHADVDPGEAFVAHAAEQFYFGREVGGLLFSPADETPSPPVDAKPEEIDLARAIDAINICTTLGLRSVSSSWAGLRTFSADGSIVIGPDPAEPTFIWCGGQGGYGIHTCPAAARATAALTLGDDLPADLTDGGLRADHLTPDRLR
jgi:D-arginine dehydrogenase